MPESATQGLDRGQGLRGRGAGGPPVRSTLSGGLSPRHSRRASGRSPAWTRSPHGVAHRPGVGDRRHLLHLRPAGCPASPGALVVMPFVAGLGRGIWGVSAALSTQLVVVVGLSLGSGEVTQAQMLDTFSWMMTGFGLGMVASFVHSVMLGRGRRARRLPRGPFADQGPPQRLRRTYVGPGRGQPGRADPRRGARRRPDVALAVHVPHEDGLTTLVSEGEGGDDVADGARRGGRRQRTRALPGPILRVPADRRLRAGRRGRGTLSEDFDASGWR